MSIFLIWLTGLLFVILHSILATRRCKNICYRLGAKPKTYRLAYTLTAAILTVLWLGFVYRLPDNGLYHIRGWANGVMRAVQLAGLWLAVSSLRAIDAASFLGLRTVADDQDNFVERGIYRHIRHPMYSGVILMLLASPAQTTNSLNLFAIIILYFIIGSRLEEQRMQTIHHEYADYRRRVSAFIPCPGARRARE